MSLACDITCIIQLAGVKATFIACVYRRASW